MTQNTVSSVEVTFQHPVTGETFKADRYLVSGNNFSLQRMDSEEGWVYCGSLTPYSPAPIRDALSCAIGHEVYLDSFSPDSKSLMLGMKI